jgi:hypothetical protein
MNKLSNVTELLLAVAEILTAIAAILALLR